MQFLSSLLQLLFLTLILSLTWQLPACKKKPEIPNLKEFNKNSTISYRLVDAIYGAKISSGYYKTKNFVIINTAKSNNNAHINTHNNDVNIDKTIIFPRNNILSSYRIINHNLNKQETINNVYPLWQVYFDSSITSGPILENNTLYIATNKGLVYALNSKTGAIKWFKNIGNSILSTLIIKNKYMYLITIDAKLVKLNLNNRQIVWSSNSHKVPLAMIAGARMQVTEDKIYLAFEDGKVGAFNAKDGTSLWVMQFGIAKGRTEFERIVDFEAQIKYSNGFLYALSYNNSLFKINSFDSQTIWSFKINSTIDFILEEKKKSIYLVSSDDVIYNLDAENGVIKWQIDSYKNRRINYLHSLNEDLFVVADSYGWLHFISKKNGETEYRILFNELKNTKNKTALLKSDKDYIYHLNENGILKIYLQE